MCQNTGLSHGWAVGVVLVDVFFITDPLRDFLRGTTFLQPDLDRSLVGLGAAVLLIVDENDMLQSLPLTMLAFLPFFAGSMEFFCTLRVALRLPSERERLLLLETSAGAW